MASDCKLVVVLYAEAKLQKSISLSANFTISKAKQAGMEAIKEHLKILPGVPLVTLDPDCTDFYPVPRDDNTIICTLKGDITMVVYPQPLEGQHLTPSPFVDALRSVIHEVRDVKAQQNVAPLAREESTEHYVKPADNINDILLRKFQAMEERYGHDMAELKQVNTELTWVISGLQDDNAQLKHDMEEQRRVISGLQDDNAQLKHDMEEQRRVISGLQDNNAQLKQDNAKLKQDNAQLKYDIKELRGQLDETNRAVLGDKVAIDRICHRVLLDMGRNQLAMICGHTDWKGWKDEKATSTQGDDHAVQTAMMTEAEVMLQNSTDASKYWTAVGQDR
ncbi:uncharacterized protein F5147DRAFT_779225 [Suillus discolor]|uniref:Uncharacterized protein n=1 Tax=Suillus discolor TaxID=1912936 RepID=A0A9P7EWX2_9AGAM|nr:uncharacterized protein F5147DRAFT_779225 [Suillus discolor]KAG2093710.1 hypothetical protein F5147DRAFT_779225 [Suillus discolor]